MFHSKSIENVYSNNRFHAMFQNVRRSIALETANNTIALGSKPCNRCGIPTMPQLLLGKTTPLASTLNIRVLSILRLFRDTFNKKSNHPGGDDLTTI